MHNSEKSDKIFCGAVYNIIVIGGETMSFFDDNYNPGESGYEGKREKAIIKRHIKKRENESENDHLTYEEIDELEDMEEDDF